MKRYSVLIILLMVIRLIIAQSSSINWITIDGGNSDDIGTSVTTDENYVYSTGIFTDTCFIGDTVLISNGDYDVYISKYDKEGKFIWVKQFGGTEYDRCTQILHKNGRIIMTGYFGSTVSVIGKPLIRNNQTGFFLLDMDVNGIINWVKEIEGSESYYGNAVTIDTKNNIYVSGCFRDTLTMGKFTLVSNGERDVFTAKLDDEGQVIWINQAGGVGEDISTSITSDKLNNIYLTGSFEYTATFGDTTIISSGYQDIFIVGYNTWGEQIWLQNAGGEWGAKSSSITINSSDNIYLTGIFGGTAFFGNDTVVSNGSFDVFLAKYNISGKLQRINTFGGIEHDNASDLAVDDKFVYLLSHFAAETIINDTTIPDYSTQLIQFTETGKVLDIIQVGEYYRNKCTIDNNSALFVTGTIGPWPQMFGETIFSPSSYSYDIFIARINYQHTGIEEPVVHDSQFIIYPNPATIYINIESDNNTIISIVNINGQLIEQYFFSKDMSEKKVDISGFPPGLYIITSQTENKYISKKMIKY